MKTYQSFSLKETKALGKKFAEELFAVRECPGRRPGARRRGAAIFALQGDLGAGKTTFVQGFFEGLGLKKRAPSPTFIIMRRHTLRGRRRFSNVFHVDAYRLKDARALITLGFEDILTDPNNIILIEWAERAKKILPKNATWLKFKHGRKENERSIGIMRG